MSNIYINIYTFFLIYFFIFSCKPKKVNEEIDCSKYRIDLNYKWYPEITINIIGNESNNIYRYLDSMLILNSKNKEIRGLTIKSKVKLHIPENISLFKHISSLSLDIDTLGNISEELWKLQNIETLFIGGLYESIPEEIIYLKSLKVLAFEGYNFKTIPDIVFEIDSLVSINPPFSIEYVSFEKLKKLKHLESINLRGRKLLDSLVKSERDLIQYIDSFKKELPCVSNFIMVGS